MRVIKLTRGAGNGIDRACLMTASNMLIGRGEDGDDNSCVCPVIRAFIISTNDAMPEKLLGDLYGQLAWEILGTRTDDVEIMRRRAFCFADWAVRRVVPIALRANGLEAEAANLESLAKIVDRDTARAADAADAAARAAAYAAVDAARAAAWQLCPEIIRKVAAIGDTRPVEVVLTREELACKLGN